MAVTTLVAVPPGDQQAAVRKKGMTGTEQVHIIIGINGVNVRRIRRTTRIIGRGREIDVCERCTITYAEVPGDVSIPDGGVVSCGLLNPTPRDDPPVRQ
jgi:hypothetical protein